jgi:HSP20 family protein
VTDDDVIVVMDLPGLKPDDVTIELRQDALTVSGERPLPYQTEDDFERPVWQRVERGFGKFERVLYLRSGLDPDSITASMSDRVLRLSIPKPQDKRKRRIEIATGEKPATIEGPATDRHEPAGATT